MHAYIRELRVTHSSDLRLQLNPFMKLQFKPSYLSGLNESVSLTFVRNLDLLMKRAPVLWRYMYQGRLCKQLVIGTFDFIFCNDWVLFINQVWTCCLISCPGSFHRQTCRFSAPISWEIHKWQNNLDLAPTHLTLITEFSSNGGVESPILTTRTNSDVF